MKTLSNDSVNSYPTNTKTNEEIPLNSIYFRNTGCNSQYTIAESNCKNVRNPFFENLRNKTSVYIFEGYIS